MDSPTFFAVVRLWRYATKICSGPAHKQGNSVMFHGIAHCKQTPTCGFMLPMLDVFSCQWVAAPLQEMAKSAVESTHTLTMPAATCNGRRCSSRPWTSYNHGNCPKTLLFERGCSSAPQTPTPPPAHVAAWRSMFASLQNLRPSVAGSRDQ